MTFARFCALAAFAAAAGAALGATETITCTQKGGAAAYKLDVDWTAEKASISVKSGDTFKKQFAGAAVVRNMPNDLALLAEGTAREFVGDFNGKCGVFIEALNFDLHAGAGGKREGTVTRETVWASRGSKKCTMKQAISEMLTTVDEVTCL